MKIKQAFSVKLWDDSNVTSKQQNPTSGFENTLLKKKFFKTYWIKSLLFFQSFFGFGQTAEISIELADSEKRKQVELKNEEDQREKHYLYYDGETVAGTVCEYLMSCLRSLKYYRYQVYLLKVYLHYEESNYTQGKSGSIMVQLYTLSALKTPVVFK